ncbi:MAG TPA: SAF domain-containing protein, partial [Acidimicrobiales bacterium]|nr:SAF domain-containing protein [Acidimicrobiales bacterium]
MRRRFRRHPAVFWLAAGLLAVLAFSSVSRATARGHRFDPVVPVLVVRRPVPAGAVVGRDDVGRGRVPARFVPVGGLRAGAAASAVGRTALVDLVVGEVVVARRLSGLDVQGVAALVPAGRRAVVVPVGEAGVVARPGD